MGLQWRGIVFKTLGGLLVSVQYRAVIVGGGKSAVFEVVDTNRQGATVVPLNFQRKYGYGMASARFSGVGGEVIVGLLAYTHLFESIRNQASYSA